MMYIVERRQIERRCFERRRDRQTEGTRATGIYLCDVCNHDATTRKDDINYHLQDALHSITRIALQLIDAGFEFTESFYRKDKALSGASKSVHPQTIQVHWSEYLYEHLRLVGEVIAAILTLLGGLAFAAIAFFFAVFPSQSQHDSLHHKLEREDKKRQRDDDVRRREDEAYEAQQTVDRAEIYQRLNSGCNNRELLEDDYQRRNVEGTARGVMNGTSSPGDLEKAMHDFEANGERRWEKSRR